MYGRRRLIAYAQLFSLGALYLLASAQASTCPVYDDTFSDDTIVVNALPEALRPYANKLPGADKIQNAGKLSQTKRALWIVEMYRKGKGNAYYKDIINSALIVYCERFALHDRYVESTDATAAKDENDVCIVPTLGVDELGPEAGQCDSQENCYWEAPVDGQLRARKYTDEEAAAATDSLKKYAMGLGYVLGPGVILGVLNLIIMFFVVICRCCCRCCGGKSKEEGYTCCQRWTPLTFFMLFSLGVLVTATLAFIGNMDVTKGTLETFQSLDHGLIRFQRFLGRAEVPLVGISDTTVAAVNDTVKTLDNTDWLSTGVDSVVNRLVSFRDLYGSTPGLEFVASSINDTLDQVTAQVDPIVDNAESSITALNDQLVPVKSTVVEMVDMAVQMITQVNASVNGVGDNLDIYNDKTQGFSLFQFGGVMALFILSILLILLGCCGIGAGLTPCKFDDCLMVFMHITWVCGSLIVTLSFLISSVALVLGVFWHDTCQMLDVVTGDFDTYVPNAQAADTLNACFNGTSLLVAFNLTDSLSFADTLSASFADMATINVSSAFDFVESPLAQVDYDLRVYNGSEFVDALNAYTYPDYATTACNYTSTFAWENLDHPWRADRGGQTTTPAPHSEPYARQGSESPATYMNRVYSDPGCDTVDPNFNTDLIAAWQAGYDTFLTVSDMRRDLGYNATVCDLTSCPQPTFPYDTSVYAQLTVYKGNISDVNTKLTNLTDSFVGDLVDYVDLFKCNAYCDFVKTTYDDLTVAMCGTLLGGFLQIGISLFLLSLFMFALVILTMTLKTRLNHPIQRIYTTYDEQGSPGDGGEEQGEREGDGGQMEESGPKALVV